MMGSELGITIQERLLEIVLGNFMTLFCKHRIIHNTRKEKRTRKFHCAREEICNVLRTRAVLVSFFLKGLEQRGTNSDTDDQRY